MTNIHSICELIDAHTKSKYYSTLLHKYNGDVDYVDAIICRMSLSTLEKIFIQIHKYNGKFKDLRIMALPNGPRGEDIEEVTGVEWLDSNSQPQYCYEDDEKGIVMHFDHNKHEIPVKGQNSINFILD